MLHFGKRLNALKMNEEMKKGEEKETGDKVREEGK